jgi:hypothetical protein
VSRFLWADANEWRSEVMSTVGGKDVDAWLKTVGPRVEQCEASQWSTSDVTQLWVEYTASLAVLTLQTADEFLEEHPTIAARVGELLQASDVKPTTWIPGIEPRVQVFAEALRTGMAVAYASWFIGQYGEHSWDSRRPSSTIGGARRHAVRAV